MEHWYPLREEAAWQALLAASEERPQLVFKHSTTCGISAHVQHQLLQTTSSLQAVADLHLLDLLAHRKLSNQIAAETGVPHQSPQVILLHKGKPLYSASHLSVRSDAIVAAAG
jgi:bacillithiol system protein YtxJ